MKPKPSSRAPRRHARRRRSAAASRAACRPTASPAKASAATPTTTATIVLTWATSGGWTDERTQKLRRQEGRPRGRGCAGQGRPAPADVQPPQGVQVLLGQDRRHQLQGHEAAAPLRAGAREDSAAPHLGYLRAAPAEAP